MEFGEVAARFECLPLEDGPAKLSSPSACAAASGWPAASVSAAASLARNANWLSACC